MKYVYYLLAALFAFFAGFSLKEALPHAHGGVTVILTALLFMVYEAAETIAEAIEKASKRKSE